MTTKTYVPRTELVTALVTRDGLVCQHPDCGRELRLETPEGPLQVTIDHWMPQSWARQEGWSEAMIWGLKNLKLMHKKCNADKGDRVPLPDGTLPAKPQSKFRYRRLKRAERPEICESCNAGRDLGENEFCNSCNSGPQPERFPKWRQMSPKECDHDLFFCVACTIWFPEKRRAAWEGILLGGDGYDDGPAELPEEIELENRERVEAESSAKELVSI